jgi:chondroitin 4-sulfotransferase 11
MISHQHKFIFIHIPKTGGTSIENFFGKNMDHEIDKHYNLNKYYSSPDYNKNIISNYYKFTFVRNPWSFMLSCYNYCVKFDLINYSFEDFCFRKYDEQLKKDINKRGWDNGIPNLLEFGQLFWLVNGGDFDFVGKFETLQTSFDFIYDSLKSKGAELPNSKKLPHNNFTQKEGDLYYYRKFYTKQTKDVIFQRFEYEIDAFNYDF